MSGTDDLGFFEQFSTSAEATQVMPKSQFLNLKVNLSPAGRTALFDAVRFACDERMTADPVRNYLRVLILLSDGDDNSSRSDLKQAIASAQRAGVVIFAVDTAPIFFGETAIPAPRSERGAAILVQLTRETGGAAFLDLDRQGVTKAFTTIKEQIDNMYLLSYVPSDHSGTKYHSLKIGLNSQKSKVKVRAAHGYYSDLMIQ